MEEIKLETKKPLQLFTETLELQYKEHLAGCLVSSGMDYGAFMSSIKSAFMKTPQLIKCMNTSQGQMSVYSSIFLGANLGFTFNDFSQHCFIIPRYNKNFGVQLMDDNGKPKMSADGRYPIMSGGMECTIQLGYYGLIELVYRSGLIQTITSNHVCEGEEFTDIRGNRPIFEHHPAKTGLRDNPIGYYATIVFENGYSESYYMTKEQIAKFPKPVGGVTDPNYNMSKKTVLKQLLKLKPRSIKDKKLLAMVDLAERGATLRLSENNEVIITEDSIQEEPEENTTLSQLSAIISNAIPEAELIKQAEAHFDQQPQPSKSQLF